MLVELYAYIDCLNYIGKTYILHLVNLFHLRFTQYKHKIHVSNLELHKSKFIQSVITSFDTSNLNPCKFSQLQYIAVT